jgi:hypothetical protein
LGGTQNGVGDSIVVAQAKTVGPREAAEEISRQLASLDLAMIIVFVSPFYDPAIFIEELTCQIPGTPISAAPPRANWHPEAGKRTVW